VKAVESIFMLVSCLAYSLILKMEATCSSETSVDFQWTTQYYIPQDKTLHNHHYENLKSYNVKHRSKGPKNHDSFLLYSISVQEMDLK
jgi:hypothetical protein